MIKLQTTALFNTNMKHQNESLANQIKQRIEDTKQRIDEEGKIPAISMLVIIIGISLALAAGSIVACCL